MTNSPAADRLAYGCIMLFVVVGAVVKDRSAEFLAVCLQSLWLVPNVAVENVAYQPERGAFSPRLGLALLIAWIGALVYALMRY